MIAWFGGLRDIKCAAILLPSEVYSGLHIKDTSGKVKYYQKLSIVMSFFAAFFCSIVVNWEKNHRIFFASMHTVFLLLCVYGFLDGSSM